MFGGGSDLNHHLQSDFYVSFSGSKNLWTPKFFVIFLSVENQEKSWNFIALTRGCATTFRGPSLNVFRQGGLG